MWFTHPAVEQFRRGWTDVKGIRAGFGYLFRGGAFLARERQLWPLLVAPVLVNAILFLLFLFGAGFALRGLLGSTDPSSWWQVALVVMLVVATVGAILFVGAAVFVLVGSIISAPFYDTLAQHTARSRGMIVVDHPWWSHVWPSVKHAATKLWWYLLIQAGLIILYVVPGAFGPIAFVTIGYVATAFFLALDFLDFSFDFQGWTFPERRRWCLRRKGLMLGFGSAVFLGLGIPLVNLFIPPIAVVGAVLLFSDHYVSTDVDGSR